MNLPPSQQVVSIPELLHRIFLHATLSDNFSNLRVCKKWSNEVVNIEWSDVRSPRQLFELLAPLERRNDGLYHFSRPLHPRDWERFEHYAWRVKRLCLYMEQDYDSSVLLEIASGRPRLGLLPNLNELTGIANPVTLQLFATSTVKTFELYPEHSELGRPEAVDSTLPYLPVKMPAIQHLLINVSKPEIEPRKFDAVASSALAALSQLNHLILPPSWLSPAVTQAISKLENLEELNSISTDIGDLEARDLVIFSDRLEASSFPAVTDLALAIPIKRAAVCLSGAYKPSHLSTLDLCTSEAVPVEDYRHIIEVVSSNCPKLTSFDLQVNLFRLPRNYDSPPVPFDVLKPILACRDLQVLRLSHELPLDIDEGDIVAILVSLSSLSELSLNPSPTRTSQPFLHISCLSTIAPYSASLEYLGLYLDTSHDRIAEHCEVSFECLEKLMVGYSPLESASTIPVALYLSSILPEDCIVHDSQPYSKEPTPVAQCWEQVQSLLPAFRQAQKIGEHRIMHRQGSLSSEACSDDASDI